MSAGGDKTRVAGWRDSILGPKGAHDGCQGSRAFLSQVGTFPPGWVEQTWKNTQTCKPCLCKKFQICGTLQGLDALLGAPLLQTNVIYGENIIVSYHIRYFISKNYEIISKIIFFEEKRRKNLNVELYYPL